MSIDQAAIIFATIAGCCAFFIGMGIGIAVGYVIGRGERQNKDKVWDFDKLKRSDHYHYERKKEGKRGPPL
jgi:hypothetical protein